MKYYIYTFGCQQNYADSERIASKYEDQGISKALSPEQANHIIINTCMVRRSAEDRVYGLLLNLQKEKHIQKQKIILTGCMVGLALKEKSGAFFSKLRTSYPMVDEFLAIEEIGFDFKPLRLDRTHAWVPISSGCNNFCSYCIVPYTRGREHSRPFDDIIRECEYLKKNKFLKITLLGQNVNSYGTDIVQRGNWKGAQPIQVVHMGKTRIPTLFPYLLEKVAQMGFSKIEFMSSNPWDFSDELIHVIAQYQNISRTIHLPVQSGDDNVLKRMNRWYTAKQYIQLVKKMKKALPNLILTTDIIVGFPGETEAQFQNTVKICKKIAFNKAYIARYSPRPSTYSTVHFLDDISAYEKKRRWKILDTLIYKPQKNRSVITGLIPEVLKCKISL